MPVVSRELNHFQPLFLDIAALFVYHSGYHTQGTTATKCRYVKVLLTS